MLDATEPAVLDVVVAGAGVSGLAAARTLQRAGATVVVCEARDRVGGRLRSVVPAGASAAVDLGASWIWPQEPRVMALVAELGLETYPHFDAGMMLFDGPAGVQPIPGIDQVSPSLRVVGGTAAVTDALHRALAPNTVRLAHEVRAIRDEGEQHLVVEIAGRASLRARHVVLAVPPALAFDRMTFVPGLPDSLGQVALATPVWMGNIVKTVVVYDRPFWREAGFAGTAVSHLGPLNEIHDLSGPDGDPAALFGFSGFGPDGGPAPTHEAVLAQLMRLFGRDAARPSEILQRDWRTERFTSPPDVVQRTDYGLFGHPVFARGYHAGRLFFGSCETSGGSGHIEDALTAASRTAHAILAGLNEGKAGTGARA